MSMTEKCCKSLDTGGHADGFLTSLSEAYDSIGHDLLIANLNTCF